MALSDVLLVLLADRPGTAHDLQLRHASTLGSDQRVDVTRVVWTLGREERAGYLRSPDPAALAKQRLYDLTEAGRLRQRRWMLRVPPDADAAELRDRVLLAIAATDRPTFETVVAVCLARLELNRLREARPGAAAHAISPEEARIELAEATAAAQLAWMQDLRSRPRDRDRK